MSDWVGSFISELHTANGNHREVFAKYNRLMKISKAQLYRIANKHGWTSGRKKRVDKGKCRLTDGQIEYIASLVHVTAREIKGPIMPVERAIEIAEDNGIIDRGQISVGRMQQILREKQINAKALKDVEPYIPMRSLHPNHCHVFDVSVCIQYYLKGGKMGIMDERKFYRNKVDNYAKIKRRLMRYVITDHFSGSFYFRYFYAPGESEENLLRFFIEAWKNKENEKYPFHGVPFQIMMDSGAANTAGAVKSLLKELEVDVLEGLPHNPRRQGSAESAHNIIERHFESGLRIQPAVSEEELNQWAFDWAVSFNARKRHTRHGMTRSQCWLLIRPEQLRLLPAEEKCVELMKRPAFTRRVNPDYTIHYKNDKYIVKHIDGIRPNMIVPVRIRAFSDALYVSFNDTTYEVQPIEKLPAELGGFRADAAVIGQEYKAQPETLTQKAKKRFENMAYGEEKKKDAVPFEGLKVFGHQAEKVRHTFIERRGTPIELDRSIAAREISFAEFLRRLVREAGPISRELNQVLRTRYGSSIEISEAEEVIRKIQEGRWPGGESGQAQAL